jgi:hypothetical protein
MQSLTNVLLKNQLVFPAYCLAQSVFYFGMIAVLDYAPNFLRRRILSHEYSGDQLEKRLKLQINGGWPMFKALFRMSYINLRPTLTAGSGVARGIMLYPLPPADSSGSSSSTAVGGADYDSKLVDLLSLQTTPGRPLVLNFGSCSWPPFLNALKQFAAMALDPAFVDKADFVLVYLEEAHPTDGWMYASVVHKMAQHTSMDERVQCATVLHDELADAMDKATTTASTASSSTASTVGAAAAQKPRIFADTMANSASQAFGALPERLSILVDRKVAFLGGKGPEMYSVAECRAALEKMVGVKVGN